MEAVARRTNPPERSVAMVAGVALLVLAVFWQTTWSMAEIWKNSATYSHGFLIVPTFLWLVWDRRSALSRLPTHPSWRWIPCLAILGMAWVLSDAKSINVTAQFAVVAMIPASVGAILGTQWVRALAFPFLFLFFAVPFGEGLIPYMTDRTADFTVAALKLSGIPIYRDGNNFSIPSGDWSVIDACSGVRYLFASLAVATLYAWTIYRASTRRMLFVAGAAAVAIVANWLRAYLTVLVAHLSDNRLATGFDHIVFAEILYGVILLVVFWVGTFWKEPTAPTVPFLSADSSDRTGPAAT